MIFKILAFLAFFASFSAHAGDRIVRADQILNDTNSSKIDNKNSIFYDSSNLESLDWQNRRCKDPSNKFSLDWNNRITWDAAEITSIDWANRRLQDASGFNRVEWNNGTLYQNDGQQVLSFQNGLNGGRSIDQAPDIVCCDGTTLLNMNSNISNSADVENRGLTILDVSQNFDPTNNGFKIGKSSGGGGTFQLINATTNHVSSGEMGGLTVLNVNPQFGDQSNVITGGKSGFIQGIFNGMAQYAGHELSQGYTGYQANGDIYGTIPDNSGFTLFNLGFNLKSGLGKINYSLINHGTQFENDMSGHNPQGVSNSWQFKNGAIAGYPTVFSDFGQIQSGAVLDGYQSANFSPQFQTGSTVNNGTSIVGIFPSGGGTFSSDLTGLSVDVSQLTGVNPLSKSSANFSGGRFNAQIDYNLPNATQAVSPLTINANPTIPSGSPISGTFAFGLGVNTLFNAQDDMGDDGLGLKLGYTNLAATGLMVVASGKTVDAHNGFLAAQAVISPSAGTVNKYRAFRAAGYAPGGGSLTVNDMVGFYSDVILCTFAVDCWAFYDNSDAQNYLSKLAVGTANKKVSTNVKLEIHDGHVKHTQTTQPVATVDANAGTGAVCSVSGTDADGKIDLEMGSASWASGSQCAIAFDQAYNSNPVCTFSPVNANAAESATTVMPYMDTATNELVVFFKNAETATKEYVWGYHCVEAF